MACESTKIGGPFCWKLINVYIVPSKCVYVDFFSFSNKRPVRLFGTLEYVSYFLIYWTGLNCLVGHLGRVMHCAFTFCP